MLSLLAFKVTMASSAQPTAEKLMAYTDTLAQKGGELVLTLGGPD